MSGSVCHSFGERERLFTHSHCPASSKASEPVAAHLSGFCVRATRRLSGLPLLILLETVSFRPRQPHTPLIAEDDPKLPNLWPLSP